MDKDPVCGMMVGRADVAGESHYQGKTFYFCSPSCKDRFDADPARYAIQTLEDRSEIE
jgi:P-type Cu+ transporter